MDTFLEIIGNALSDYDDYAPENAEMKREINQALETIADGYAIVPWPESQEYMEEDWFNEEAILDVEGKFGSSAYFIPLKRLIK